MSRGERRIAEGMQRLGKDALIEQLHAEAPLYRDGGGFWVASAFEDVREILLDHEHFSSSAMGGEGGFGLPLLTDDPPRHGVLRALLAKAFTPAAMEDMRPAIEGMARDLVAAIPAGMNVDIVAALTTPLPVAVIAGMMGVPRERERDFKRWSNAMIGIQESPFESDRIKTLMELRTYFSNLAAERRTAPGDDLVSAMTRANDATETLNDEQIVGFCMLLMIAGNETTTNLLGNLLDRLADAPEAWAALRADPALIEGAIEESLRIDSPVQMVMRRARADVQVRDATIRKGETVLVYFASANRDPAKWQDAANFALNRARERHVAFGHGVHTCIGAPLARMEAKAAMTALTQRFATLRRGEVVARRLPMGLLFGYRELPLVLGV